MKRVTLCAALGSSVLGPLSGASAPAAEPPPRAHSLTVMAPNDGAAAFDSSFGAGNWKALSPYVDLLIAPRTTAVPKDMLAAQYFDANLCSNAVGPGRNAYALPDCSSWPDGAFYSQPGHPDRALSTKAGGILQRFTDPASSAMRAQTLGVVEAAIERYDDDLVYLDDASPPQSFYAEMCWGTPSFEKGSAACAGAPGGTARGPFASEAQWAAGMRRLIDAVSRRVVLNGGLSADSAHVPTPANRLVASDANVWGAVCDGCFYGNAPGPKNKYLWSGPVLSTGLDGIMHAIGAGKNVVMVDYALTDPGARARALADVMLFYQPDRTWFWYNVCGPHSHIRVCPEAALTFYHPLLAYPKDVRDVSRPGGAFAREFAACYDGGKAVGPCAAVVNPEPEKTVALPELHGAYGHTLHISGLSLCRCYGDDGSLAFDGPAPPRELPPASGYVLFP